MLPRPSTASEPRVTIQVIGTPAIQNAAPNTAVISTVWPMSGSISSRPTATA